LLKQITKLSFHSLLYKENEKGWDYSSVLEHLPNKCSRSSISGTSKKKGEHSGTGWPL
jgi:hypothetical protein